MKRNQILVVCLLAVSLLFGVGLGEMRTRASGVRSVSAARTASSLTLSRSNRINPVGQPHCVVATVGDDYGNPLPGVNVNFSVSGRNQAAGTGVTDANGQSPFCYTGTQASLDTVTATAADGSNATDTATKIYFTSVSGGAFAIGDQNSAIGKEVTFWGAQWWKRNSLTGGSAPPAFKGFVNSPAQPTCGTPWTTDPGNSSGPPPAPLPAYIAVIVSSSITQSGSVISGNTPSMVVVQTNPGYAPDPGHAGTGTVVALICPSGPPDGVPD
jgi:hypothetical protein